MYVSCVSCISHTHTAHILRSVGSADNLQKLMLSLLPLCESQGPTLLCLFDGGYRLSHLTAHPTPFSETRSHVAYPDWPQTHCVAKDELEFLISLLQGPPAGISVICHQFYFKWHWSYADPRQALCHLCYSPGPMPWVSV